MVSTIKGGISQIYKDIKIDFTNCMILEHDYLGDFTVKTEISPIDYLQFAKEDLNIGSVRGLIDGLCNAKRAIDCQVDSIMTCLGYDYIEFDKSGSYSEAKKFINEMYKEKSSIGTTLKMKFLNILGLLPTLLIGKIRNLRNLVEHEYVIPEKNEVYEAIEVAELFIYSSNKKICDTISLFTFGSNYKTQIAWRVDNSQYDWNRILPKFLSVEFNYHKEKKIQVVLVNETGNILPFDNSLTTNIYYDIDTNDKQYAYLLKVFFDKDYKLLPTIFGFNVPKEYIKFNINLT